MINQKIRLYQTINKQVSSKISYPIMQGLLSSLLKQMGCEMPVSFPHGNKNHLQTNKTDKNTNDSGVHTLTKIGQDMTFKNIQVHGHTLHQWHAPMHHHLQTTGVTDHLPSQIIDHISAFRSKQKPILLLITK